jgi:hypothetical protein
MAGMGTVVLVCAIAAAAYLASLRLHPWRSCRGCSGSGRARGSVFTYSHRQCGSCGGNGRRARIGVRVIHRNGKVWGERKPEAAAERRGRNLGR